MKISGWPKGKKRTNQPVKGSKPGAKRKKKLTTGEVYLIRFWAWKGIAQTELACEYGVHRNTIGKIISGKIYV